MALSPGRQIQIWVAVFLLTVLCLWILGNTLLPFFVGAAIAYFLDPIADRLEQMGLGRIAATGIIAIFAVILFVIIMLLIIPALIGQIRDLIEAAPTLLEKATGVFANFFPSEARASLVVSRGIATLQERMTEYGPTLLNSVLASSLAVVDFVILLVLAPVIAFYLLLDWDRMIAVIDSWLPRDHVDSIRNLARQIDIVLAGFVRGQVLVCIILGTFYALALTAIGLPYGFLVGMLAGLLSFIPYVGSLTGGVLSIGIALAAFWSTPIWIFATAAIFGFGQFVEGNILSPRLIGKSVGLHPVLLILALSVFGSLFGFTGMLVAVPVAASMGVLGRFGVDLYLQSPLYAGKVEKRDERIR